MSIATCCIARPEREHGSRNVVVSRGAFVVPRVIVVKVM